MIKTATSGVFHPFQVRDTLQAYLTGAIAEDAWHEAMKAVRYGNWHIQKQAEIDLIPTNDFCLTDPLYEMSHMLGLTDGDLRAYYTKTWPKSAWFDTGESFFVPPFQDTASSQNPPPDHPAYGYFQEALGMGIKTLPVLPGPVSFLEHAGLDIAKARHYADLLPRYVEILNRFAAMGAEWTQIEEPALAGDLPNGALKHLHGFLQEIGQKCALKSLLAVYFGGVKENLKQVMGLPVAGLHLDLTADSGQSVPALDYDQGKIISWGLINGRGLHVSDIGQQLTYVERSVSQIGLRRTIIAVSCPLRHYPEADYRARTDAAGLAEGRMEKLEALMIMGRAMNIGKQAVHRQLAANQARLKTALSVVESK